MKIRKNIYNKTMWLLTTALYSSFSINTNNLNGSLILLAITLLALFVFALNNNFNIPIRWSKMQLYIIMLGLFCYASALWAEHKTAAIVKGTTIFEILVCITVYYLYYSTQPNSTKLLLKSLIWGGYIITIYSFYHYGTSNIFNALLNAERLSSSFDNVNAIGYICAITIIVSIYFLLYDRLNLTYIMVIPTFLLLLASESRKALIALVFGIIAMLVLKAITERSFKAIITFIIAAISIIIVIKALPYFSIFSGMSSRMEGLIALFYGKGNIDHSSWIRKRYIEIGIDTFKQHPLMGIGMGNASYINEIITGDHTYLHNNYVELLASGGVLAFVLYYTPFIYVIKEIFRNKLYLAQECPIILVLIVCSWLADFGVVSYYSKNTYFCMMIYYICLEENLRKNNGLKGGRI